jgi:ADP-heptose:LPS heptosyltransferase
MQPRAIKKIAFINFGGIGDEILFSPVIEEVKKALPQAHVTLFLEDRSQAVRDLMPNVDTVIALDIQKQSRIKAFFQLWNLLRNKYFDAVISSGSNPMIPVLLWLSGIPIRVGFGTGKTSQKFLTVEGYLAPRESRTGYAADMYFTLASSFLHWLLKEEYSPPNKVLPHLKPLNPEDLEWARDKLKAGNGGKKILIHPGVSAISIQKNILKSWPAASWAQLIQQLAAEGHQVFLVGGPDDRETVEAIRRMLPPQLPGFTDLYGQTRNLKQLAALICASDLLLGVDSSPMHIAVGYQKPTIAMFGPTDEKKLLPDDSRFRAVGVSDLSCRPCLWDVRNESCDRPACLDVPVEAMMQAVREVLKASSLNA